MIRLKNEKEIAGIRASGDLLAETLQETLKLVADGVTTRELDSFVRSRIESKGGRPAFLGYMNYPGFDLHFAEQRGHPRHSRASEAPQRGPREHRPRGGPERVFFGLRRHGRGGHDHAAAGAADAGHPRVPGAGSGAGASRATGSATSRAPCSSMPPQHGCGVVREYCGHGTGLRHARGSPGPELRRARVRTRA